MMVAVRARRALSSANASLFVPLTVGVTYHCGPSTVNRHRRGGIDLETLGYWYGAFGHIRRLRFNQPKIDSLASIIYDFAIKHAPIQSDD